MSDDLKLYTFEEVSKHNTINDLWVVYNQKVYDVSKYVDEHPGGEEVVVYVAGTDATEAFDDIGHSEDAHEIMAGLLVGRVEGGVKTDKKVPVSGTYEAGLPVTTIAAVVVLVAAGAYFYLNQ